MKSMTLAMGIVAASTFAQILPESQWNETSSGATEIKRKTLTTGSSNTTARAAADDDDEQNPSMMKLGMLGAATGVEWVPSLRPEKTVQFLASFAFERSDLAKKFPVEDLPIASPEIGGILDQLPKSTTNTLRFSPLTIRLGGNSLMPLIPVDEAVGVWTSKASPYIQFGVGASASYTDKVASVNVDRRYVGMGANYTSIYDTTYSTGNSNLISLGWYTDLQFGLDYRIQDNFGVYLGYRWSSIHVLYVEDPDEGMSFADHSIAKDKTYSQSSVSLGLLFRL